MVRINLNQQSPDALWATHRSLMTSMSPIADRCVHDVDVMCTQSGGAPVNHSPIRVNLTISLWLRRRMGGPQVPVPLLT